jgi:3-hydroxybutyryl-CoA dehydratase
MTTRTGSLFVGQKASLAKVLDDGDIVAFADATGDHNPIHLDDAYARATPFRGRIAHGMLTAGVLSALLGTHLPGPGCIYVSQLLCFKAPVRPGDEVVAEVEVTALDDVRHRVGLRTLCRVGDRVVLEGEATLLLPPEIEVLPFAAA